MKRVQEKRCSECGEIKTIHQFDKTMSGKRWESMCKTCKIQQFEPKKPPKIMGYGLPITGFNEGKKVKDVTREEDNIQKLIKNRGDEMKQNLLTQIEEYVTREGDGFTAKQLGESLYEKPTTLYYWFDILRKKRELFKVDGKVRRYFRYKKNKDYWVKMKPGRRDEEFQKQVLQDIKEGNIRNIEKEQKKVPPQVDRKLKGRIRETMKKETKTKNNEKIVDLNEAVNNIIDVRLEELREEIINKLLKVEKRIELITPDKGDIKSNVKKVLEEMIKEWIII